MVLYTVGVSTHGSAGRRMEADRAQDSQGVKPCGVALAVMETGAVVPGRGK